MLLNYAASYPTLSLHPVKASSEPGRLFWQTLNESVWLVYTSIAYDCVREHIPAKDRAIIPKNVFYPMAEFIMQGTPNNKKTFNKMDNHGTWADTAVGLIGYTMEDKTFVDKALYGTERDGTWNPFYVVSSTHTMQVLSSISMMNFSVLLRYLILVLLRFSERQVIKDGNHLISQSMITLMDGFAMKPLVRMESSISLICLKKLSMDVSQI